MLRVFLAALLACAAITLLSSCVAGDVAHTPFYADEAYVPENTAGHAPENPAELQLFSEMIAKIHDDLPYFTFRAYYTLDDSEYISTLRVTDSQSGALISHLDLRYIGEWQSLGIPSQHYESHPAFNSGLPRLIDVNFDEYKDMEIFAGLGTWNSARIYFIWDPVAHTFVYDPHGLSKLGLPRFDAETQLIRSMQRSGAARHWYYTHQFIDGQLVTIEEISRIGLITIDPDGPFHERIVALEPLYTWENSALMHYKIQRRDLDTMEMVVIKNVFRLYPRLDYAVKIVEHDYDSELGLVIRELLEMRRLA